LRYDFGTEVYFVGKLFEQIIVNTGITDFSYTTLLAKMCEHDPHSRTASFVEIEREVLNSQFGDADFSDYELGTYRAFATALQSVLVLFYEDVKYIDDHNRVERQLDDAYRRFMLEENVPDLVPLIRCFIDGGLKYRKGNRFSVATVKAFMRVFRSASEAKRRMILANLHTRFDLVPKEEPPPPAGEDIPF
jgi:serine/threonine-protein kinase